MIRFRFKPIPCTYLLGWGAYVVVASFAELPTTADDWFQHPNPFIFIMFAIAELAGLIALAFGVPALRDAFHVAVTLAGGLLGATYAAVILVMRTKSQAAWIPGLFLLATVIAAVAAVELYRRTAGASGRES